MWAVLQVNKLLQAVSSLQWYFSLFPVYYGVMAFNKQASAAEFWHCVFTHGKPCACPCPLHPQAWVWAPCLPRQHPCSGYVFRLHVDAKSLLFWYFIFIASPFWVCLTSASFNLPVLLLSHTFVLFHSANWINALSVFIAQYWFDNTSHTLFTIISYFLWTTLNASPPPPLHLDFMCKITAVIKPPWS